MAFKKLTAGLMASSMILGLAATASAEITTATPFETAVKMNKLGIVVGNGTNPDGTIDFNLGGNLTRAELVTTIVRSFGAEQAAQLAKGAPSFADVAQNEWYSGYVAVAKNLAEQAGTTIGRDANTFDPTANVSKAEALVFVMKFLGVKVSSTGANWYEAWIAKAVELGMISEADAAVALASPGSPATRGEAFVILDFGYSAKVLEGGASLYTAFVDSVKPTVEASAVETTAEATVTVSGKVSDNKGVAAVFVNGAAVEVKDGNFSAEVELKVGKNTIEVSATDVAGNSQSKTLTVTRANAEAASIEAADVTVVAGGEASVAAKLLDANGAEIADAEIEGTSDVGEFKAGKFTAGTKAGEGKLTLKAGEITKEVTVKVTAAELAKVVASASSVGPNEAVTLAAQDEFGNAVEGATFAQESADAFLVGNRFLATKGGSYTVSATANGKTVSSTVSVYGAVAKFLVEAPATAVANDDTEYTITVKAVDANGAVVADYDTAIATPSLPSGFTLVDSEAMSDGVATFVYTVDPALANTRVTAKYTTGSITGSAAIDVAAQVPTAISVSTPSAFLPNNNRAVGTTVTVNVLDQAGAKMVTGSGAWNMDVALTGPASLADNAVTKTGTKLITTAAKTFSIYPEASGETGEVNLTVSFTGLKTGEKKLSAQFAQAAANIVVKPVDGTEVKSSKLATGNYVEYKISLTDKNGVPVNPTTAPAYSLTFSGITDKAKVFAATSATGAAAGYGGPAAVSSTVSVTSSATDGSALVKIGGEKAESFTFTVGATGLTTSAAQVVTVKPAAKDNIGFTNSTSLKVLRSDNNVVTLEAAVKDAQGNAVPTAGYEIKFQAGSYDGVKLNGKAEDFVAKTDANGKATVEVELAGYLTSATVSIANPGGGMTVGTGTTVSLVNTVPASIAVEFRNTNGVVGSWVSGAAGSLAIRATVKDNFGRPVTDLSSSDFTAKSSSDNVSLSGLTWNKINPATGLTDATSTAGVYEATVASSAFTVAENVQIDVSVANLLATVKDGRTLSVLPGTSAAKVVVAEATKTATAGTVELDVDNNVVKAITVQLADANGNVVSPLVNTAGVSVTIGALTGGVEVRDANGLAAGSSQTIGAGRNSITLYVVDGDSVGSFSLTYGGNTLIVNLK